METAQFYKINSFTNPEKAYMVRHMPSGEWVCGCPSFLFRNQPCDHIRRVRHQKMKSHGRQKIKKY